jgi:[ribosomal protein S5]-alanine N-acetyltransferase
MVTPELVGHIGSRQKYDHREPADASRFLTGLVPGRAAMGYPGDMNTPRTSIRLIEPDDAAALAAHLARDAEAFARWDPERPPEFYTPAGQRSRIEGMLMRYDNGEVWPGAVLADDVVIGQVTAQNILRRAWRKAELGYWIAYPHQGQGHATRAVSLAVEMMTTELGLHRAEA